MPARDDPAGVIRRLGQREASEWCAATSRHVSGLDQLDPHGVFEFDDVPDGHLATLSKLHVAVDADPALGDEDLRLTAAHDATRELEGLRQVDRTVADRQAHALRLAHFGPFWGAASRPPMR